MILKAQTNNGARLSKQARSHLDGVPLIGRWPKGLAVL